MPRKRRVRDIKDVRPKMSVDPKVAQVRNDIAKIKGGPAPVREAVDAMKAELVEKLKKPLPRSGPTKTQVCDAIREGHPGLTFAAVDRIATVVMKLYGDR